MVVLMEILNAIVFLGDENDIVKPSEKRSKFSGLPVYTNQGAYLLLFH
jgi:hypothetical protein